MVPSSSFASPHKPQGLTGIILVVETGVFNVRFAINIFQNRSCVAKCRRSFRIFKVSSFPHSSLSVPRQPWAPTEQGSGLGMDASAPNPAFLQLSLRHGQELQVLPANSSVAQEGPAPGAAGLRPAGRLRGRVGQRVTCPRSPLGGSRGVSHGRETGRTRA